MKPKLIIMVGNIASGKTTWIKNYLAAKSTEELKNWIVLSKDDLRRMIGAGKYIFDEKLEPIIYLSIFDLLSNFMYEDVNIIIDETNMDKETRKGYLHLTKKYNSLGYDYETIAVVIPKISMDHAVKRIAQREGVLGWAEAPKEDWIRAWKRKQGKFEIPTKEEGFNEIWKVDNEDLLSWEIK